MCNTCEKEKIVFLFHLYYAHRVSVGAGCSSGAYEPYTAEPRFSRIHILYNSPNC